MNWYGQYKINKSVTAAVSSLAHFTIWTASLIITLYSFKWQPLGRGFKCSSTVRSEIGLISLFSPKQLYLVFLIIHSYYLNFLNKPLENSGEHFLFILLSLLPFFPFASFEQWNMRSSECRIAYSMNALKIWTLKQISRYGVHTWFLDNHCSLRFLRKK